MILGRSEAHIARAKVLALHGMSKDAWSRFSDTGYRHYQVVDCGFKYNMMDLQAAIGIHQLARVEAHSLRRREIWDRYQRAFENVPLGLPAEPAPNTRHAYHLYTVSVDREQCGVARDDFLDQMNAQGIGTGVHYLSVPEHPYYQQRFGWRPEQWPHAMRIGRETVSLPISAKLSDSDLSRIVESSIAVLGKA
jgi:dTDP-4-amino-4,6-dideoxygalactose transaminase